MPYLTGSWGEQQKKRSKKRLEYFKRYNKEYYNKNVKKFFTDKDKIIYDRDHGKVYRNKWRSLVLQTLGNKCIQCGFSDYRALQIDHVNSDGYKDKSSRGAGYWKKVIKSIENNENKFQLLCANCNFIKRYTHQELSKRKEVIN